MSQTCLFCCKSLFALAINISFGCIGYFQVNLCGTTVSEEKLAGDPGNVIEATSIGGRRSDFFTAGKLAPDNFGLLQQYLPRAAVSNRSKGSALFDHLIGAGEQRGRHFEAEHFGGLEVDHQFKLRRLLNGEIGGFCAFKDLVDIASSTPM